MNREERNFIKKNIVELIQCTKDLQVLGTYLDSESFISRNTFQSIMRSNPGDTWTQTHEIYDQCMKTPNYNKLVEVLNDSGNEEAANILKRFQGLQPSSPQVIQPVGTPSTPTPITPATPAPLEDFVVTENGVASIVDVLKESNLRMEESWSVVQGVLLSPSKRDSIQENNLGIRILRTLKTWIEDAKENATFSKLHNSIKNANINAADALRKNKEIIQSKC